MTNDEREWTHAETRVASFSAYVRQYGGGGLSMHVDATDADPPRRPRRQLGPRRSTGCGPSSPPGSTTASSPPTSPRTSSCAASPRAPSTASTTRPPGCTGRPATPSSTTTAPAAPTTPLDEHRRLARPGRSDDRAQRRHPRAVALPPAAARPAAARGPRGLGPRRRRRPDPAPSRRDLGISVSGMKSRVQRARRELKDLLEHCCVVELDTQGAIADYHPTPGSCGCSATPTGLLTSTPRRRQ